jgi:hypothetical protein
VLLFREEGLEGTFVIDLDIELDNTTPVVSDEISDPKDLEYLYNSCFAYGGHLYCLVAECQYELQQ